MPKKKNNPSSREVSEGRGKKESSSLKRQFGVVLEDINSKINLVVEGHRGLNGKIDGLDKKIDKHCEEFKEFRKEVNYNFDVVFDELHLIRHDLKEKVGRDEFILLEKRVMALEKSRK